jgi:hypothetical protein
MLGRIPREDWSQLLRPISVQHVLEVYAVLAVVKTIIAEEGDL